MDTYTLSESEEVWEDLTDDTCPEAMRGRCSLPVMY